ncbi:MAG: HAD family hydrolase [Verrucomicrobiota bacterium]
MKKFEQVLFCDNEGCLTPGKGRAYDLVGLIRLREALAILRIQLVLTTGRSAPYCESLLQSIGLQSADYPMICEGGGIFFTPATERIEITKKPELPISELRNYINERINCRFEPGKINCLSLYPEGGKSVEDINIELDSFFSNFDAYFEKTCSKAAVDIVPKYVSKGYALEKWCSNFDIEIKNCIGIGDAENDKSFLQLLEKSACPANASKEIKTLSSYVSKKKDIWGTIDIINFFLG